MKKIGLVLGLLLMCLGSAAGGDIFHFRGSAAEALFVSEDTTAGTYTQVYLVADVERQQSPPGNGSSVSTLFLDLYQFDMMTGDILVEGYASTELMPGEFEIGRRLEQATLNTAVTLYDYWYGNPIGTLDIDLVFTAIGPAVKENSHDHVHAPDYTLNMRRVGTTREATVSGSIVGIDNFNADSAIYGYLEQLKLGQLFVE